ncbi:FAD/NAD(P)-binding domain-containing protein [Pleurostoma richardsiae]|uniref:FAD/NAD(P)-binding domain-containing protein n=1 Tax=Pleurostoma richardsiae TaxID=41990 RepID=A0AA38VJ32_9PEZI|nr:FAD/NAD(P)-binding domain-containing protein [Pleurostoma richardsiae]
MASAAHYDAIIVGSGQCGTPLASAFASAGRKTAIIDRAHIGGTCVNEGCTPTKTMIASGRVAYLARRGADYGVRFSSPAAPSPGDSVQVDMATIRRRKRDIVASFSGGSEARLRKNGVDILNGEARFTAPKTLAVQMNDGGAEKTVTGDVIVLNVGLRPSRPELEGLDTVAKERVLDSTSIMELSEVPKHLIVLGGGYIGLEFGQLFRRLGAEVTIVQRAGQLAPKEDADVAQCLLDILKEDGVDVHLSSRAISIASGSDGHLPLTLEIQPESGSSISVRGSHILLATGRIPNTDTLGLDIAGVKTTPKGHYIVDDQLATSAPGIYGLGDAHGGPAFTHISYDDFRIIRANLIPSAVPPTTPVMATTAASKSRNLVPYVMYTDPQLGHVGLHEADLKATGRKIKVAKMPMSYVARALETDETRGMMKAAVDAETGEILGFTCLGLEGGEVMAVMQTAIMGGVKWWDLEAAVWAHPSLAESLNNLWGLLE